MVLLEPNRVMFVCSPLVRSITEVEKLGLSLQDFPLHDPTGDLLFLLQAQRATIEDAKALNARLFTLTQALKRYVPEDLLSQLNKESIAHVQLGDHVQKILTVLFSDIRSFASLAENMSPRESVSPGTVGVEFRWKVGFESAQHQHRCCHADLIPQG